VGHKDAVPRSQGDRQRRSLWTEIYGLQATKTAGTVNRAMSSMLPTSAQHRPRGGDLCPGRQRTGDSRSRRTWVEERSPASGHVHGRYLQNVSLVWADGINRLPTAPRCSRSPSSAIRSAASGHERVRRSHGAVVGSSFAQLRTKCRTSAYRRLGERACGAGTMIQFGGP